MYVLCAAISSIKIKLSQNLLSFVLAKFIDAIWSMRLYVVLFSFFLLSVIVPLYCVCWRADVKKKQVCSLMVVRVI